MPHIYNKCVNITLKNMKRLYIDMKLHRIFIYAAVAALISSCSTSKTVLPYFTDISNITEGSYPAGDYSPEIKPDDELLITVNSVNPEASALYNLPLSNPAKSTELFKTSTPMQQTFRVNNEGNIDFPILGTLHVAGMTLEQLDAMLTQKISEDVEDPIVNVSFVNFKVSVAGEVKHPQAINVTRSRYSILDALAEAGDLTEYGERSNILLVREENGERKFVHLNLNSSDVLNSPYFYLRQNDYVYVEPNTVRQANSKYNQNNAFKLSVISTIASASSVIASLIIALAIK